MELIEKSVIVTEIKRLRKRARELYGYSQFDTAYENVLKTIDSLEVKEVDVWHLQEKENIYDAVKDWGLHTFACIMKDGTIQKFSGNMDEDYEGHINVHIDGVKDDYDNVDDIVKWIEII